MNTDEGVFTAAPAGPRQWRAAEVRHRLVSLAGPSESSGYRVTPRWMALLIVVLVGGVAWLVLRPPSQPSIETLLPRANASGSQSQRGSTGPTGAIPSAGGAAVTTSVADRFVVHIVGAVVSPGVVHIAVGSRVLDAVAAAGGLTLVADTNRVNLAAKVLDGQHVVIPRIGEVVPTVVDDAASVAGAGTGQPDPSSPINLNDATPAQLDALPGVGPVTAAAIIAYRAQHGPFRNVNALTNVRGVGPSMLEQLRPLVRI